MPCDEEFNALRRAEQQLAAWRKEHHITADNPIPAGDAAGSATADIAVMQRLAELTAAVKERQQAYIRCRGRVEDRDNIESLMRDASGAPLGGGAGPPM